MAKNNRYRPREHRSTASKCVLLHYECVSIDTVSDPMDEVHHHLTPGYAPMACVEPLGNWCSSKLFFDSTHHNAVVRFLGEHAPRMLTTLELLSTLSRPLTRSESTSMQALYRVCLEHAADIRRIHDKIMEEQNGLK